MFFRKEVWIMDPASDKYYRWLTIIAGPVFYNLVMLVTRFVYIAYEMKKFVCINVVKSCIDHFSIGLVSMSFRTLIRFFGSSWTTAQM